MLKITRDHPSLQVKEAVTRLCTAFFEQHGFNYFQYLRCYKDGSFSLLTNETGLLEYFSQVTSSPVIFSSYTEDHEKLYSYWFLWDEELPDYPVSLAREKYNLHHGLTLVRRSRNYYDMIAVALSEEKSNVASFYLTKRPAIEQFINIFDKNNYDLINYINKNLCVLPKPYRDINYQNICLPKGRIEVSGRSGTFYITAKEVACLRLLLQGATDKQIAQILHVSPRTVETYIARIKHKTGAVYRSDLDDLISVCP